MEKVLISNGKFIFVVLIAYLFVNMGVTEEECQKQEVKCYECDSRTDPRCADPFNYTLSSNFLPSTITCKGCCVKIVRMKGTDYEWIWRTCTQRIKINLFIVDHVCMYESNQIGHMCFCEENNCNQAVRPLSASCLMVCGSIFLSMLHSVIHKSIS